MATTQKPLVFFNQNTLIADRWSLELLANAARRRLPFGPEQHLFIELESFMDSHLHFLVILASAPNKPARVWKATVIDEEQDPQFNCLSVNE